MSDLHQVVVERDQLRAELSIAKQHNRQLQAEVAALSNHIAVAVTDEISAKLATPEAELRDCYRCGHRGNNPVPGCECCAREHHYAPPDPED